MCNKNKCESAKYTSEEPIIGKKMKLKKNANDKELSFEWTNKLFWNKTDRVLKNDSKIEAIYISVDNAIAVWALEEMIDQHSENLTLLRLMIRWYYALLELILLPKFLLIRRLLQREIQLVFRFNEQSSVFKQLLHFNANFLCTINFRMDQ